MLRSLQSGVLRCVVSMEEERSAPFTGAVTGLSDPARARGRLCPLVLRALNGLLPEPGRGGAGQQVMNQGAMDDNIVVVTLPAQEVVSQLL